MCTRNMYLEQCVVKDINYCRTQKRTPQCHTPAAGNTNLGLCETRDRLAAAEEAEGGESSCEKNKDVSDLMA